MGRLGSNRRVAQRRGVPGDLERQNTPGQKSLVTTIARCVNSGCLYCVRGFRQALSVMLIVHSPRNL